MRVVLVTCVALFAMGCEKPQVQRPKMSAFGCSGQPQPVLAPSPVPMGRVEVKALGEGPEGTRLRVLAENAPASQLAIRIGEVLGATTRIDPELERISVSIYIPDVSVDLLAALLRTSRVRLSVPDWKKERLLVFRQAQAGDSPEAAPIESQVMPPSRTMTPDQVASLFCRGAASSVGWAQVIGDRVMISDRRLYLDRFVSIMERADR